MEELIEILPKDRTDNTQKDEWRTASPRELGFLMILYHNIEGNKHSNQRVLRNWSWVNLNYQLWGEKASIILSITYHFFQATDDWNVKIGSSDRPW